MTQTAATALLASIALPLARAALPVLKTFSIPFPVPAPPKNRLTANHQTDPHPQCAVRIRTCMLAR